MNRLLIGMARHWRVSDDCFDPATLPRAAVVTALFSSSVRRTVVESGFATADFRRAPQCQSHPVAAVICERPLRDEVGFTDRWLREGLAAALERAEPNPVLLTHGRLLVEFTAEFCRLVGLVPPDMAKGWIFDRLRQPRYVLHADVIPEECASLSFAELTARVPEARRRFLTPQGFICRMPLTKSGRPTLDQKLARELREKLAARGVSDRLAIEAGILAVEDAVMADLEALAEAGFAERAEEQARSFFGTWGAAYSEGVRHYRSAVPVPGGLGASDIELVIACAKRDREGPFKLIAESLLVGCAVWHPPHELTTLDVEAGMVDSRLCHREPPRDHRLHRPAGDKFFRVLPTVLVQRLRAIQQIGSPGLDEINQYLSGLRPWLTWAGIREALLTIGPAVWGYPSVLPMLGFYAPDRHSPVARSYIRVDWRYIARTERWLKLFDPDFEMPSSPVGYAACGSPNVPVTSELWKFHGEVDRLLQIELPKDLDDALARVNALAAGLFLLGPVLLGGLRNWPVRDADLTRASIGRQKGPIYYEPPRFVREKFPIFLRRIDELCGRCGMAGIEVDRIGIRAHGLTLVQIGEGCLRVMSFSQRAVAEALLMEESTRRWSGLYPGAMRHFSMTELYAAGCDEHEIERFHHRAPSALNPFRVHRLEPVADRNGSRLEEHLWKSLSSCTE